MSVCIVNYDIRILSALSSGTPVLSAFRPHLSVDKMQTETTDIKVKNADVYCTVCYDIFCMPRA